MALCDQKVKPEVNLYNPAPFKVRVGFGYAFTISITFPNSDFDTTGDWSMLIYSQADGTNLVKTINETSGITTTSNTIVIEKDDAGNTLPAGLLYFTIKKTIEGKSIPVFEGQINVIKGVKCK